MSVSMDYTDLIGVQFEYGGRGPDSYDCYGLILEIFKRQGISIPDYKSPTVIEEIAMLVADEKYRWTQLAKRNGSEFIPYASMNVGSVLEIRVKGLACHVGYIHRPRHFLHTWEGTGGVTEEKIEIWRTRILGVYSYDGNS